MITVIFVLKLKVWLVDLGIKLDVFSMNHAGVLRMLTVKNLNILSYL